MDERAPNEHWHPVYVVDTWHGQELNVLVNMQDGNLVVDTGRRFEYPRDQHVGEDGEDLRHPYADQVVYAYPLFVSR